MRIAFLLPGNVNRSGQLSGHNIRYGNTASSGTESSVIYVAEYLAECGYDVVISNEGCEHTIVDRNVTYTNYNFDYVDNKEFDVLISCLWFEHYDNLPITVNLGKFIFHAQWSRGGEVAKKACNEIGWSDLEFESFDYVHKATGIDKKTLFSKISNSEYFVFPQLTHGKLVYKDTFSLSVAEAIALGVTVVTYPLGALPEYFGDFCEFLEYPPESNIDSLENDRVSEEPKLDYTKNIIEKLKFLDSNPNYKKEKRERGVEYIKENFSINKIGPLWDNYLKSF